MKYFLFLFFWTGLVSLTHRTEADHETAVLTGLISDDKGQALFGASIKIFRNRIFVNGTISDIEGKYHMELEPGTYDVECSYTGFTTYRAAGVVVSANKIGILSFTLEANTVLKELVVKQYDVPLIEGDKLSGTTLTSEQIKNLPTRNVSATVATTAAFSHDSKPLAGKTAPKGAPEAMKRKSEAPKPSVKSTAPPITAADGARIKGSRAEPTDYYIDGIRLAATPPVMDVEDLAGEILEKAAEFFTREMPLTETTPTDGPPAIPSPRAGLLTAGEWNDLHNWNNHWVDLLADGEITQYQNMYNIFPKYRYTVLLTNEQDFPIADAYVKLTTASGETLWETRTDNTGKAECWAELFNAKATGSADVRVEAWVNGQQQTLGVPKTAKDGMNRYKIAAECFAPKNVDIVWAVDATGSMGDEIEYLKTELLDVIGRAKANNPELAFRMGTVFYRDKTDDYITKSSSLNPDIAKTVDFIRQQQAGGGGDYPEAVHSALEEAIFSQKWAENAIARICFLVLDASPHQEPAVIESIQRSIREAARLGIRIVPVTASGIQKDTEFLMKFFGLATNGTYVFLTDHSGIGGKHLEPTSDEYKVEPLNDLLVRLITEYTTIKTCEGQSTIRFEEPQALQQQQRPNWEARYYPNPAVRQFTLELPFDVQSVTIYDAEGKSVRKLEKPQAGVNMVQVGDLPEGFYTIRILKDGRMQSGKLMVVRA